MNDAHAFAGEAEDVDAIVRLVAAVRRIRAEQELEPGVKVEVEVHPKGHAEAFEASRSIVERLVRAESLHFADVGSSAPAGATVAVDPSFEVAVRLGQADRDAEKARLEKQLGDARRHLEGLEKRLANENFVTRAKPEAVEKTRVDAEKARTTIASIEERLGKME